MPLLTPIKGSPLLVVLGVLLVVLRNRGGEWADAWVWRVRGRLAVDGRVELRVRDAALRAEIVEASRTAGVAATEAPRFEV